MFIKTILFTTIFLLASASGFAQKAVVGKVDPAKGVRDALDRLAQGIKQVDANKVMSSYEKSDRLLIFNNNGTVTMGWDNVNSNVTSSYSKLTNVTLELTGIRVEMMGKTGAFVSCKWKQSQENAGTLENASGRMTLIFKLVGKDWKISHRHTSPDNPDANRPVFPSERVPQ